MLLMLEAHYEAFSGNSDICFDVIMLKFLSLDPTSPEENGKFI